METQLIVSYSECNGLILKQKTLLTKNYPANIKKGLRRKINLEFFNNSKINI